METWNIEQQIQIQIKKFFISSCQAFIFGCCIQQKKKKKEEKNLAAIISSVGAQRQESAEWLDCVAAAATEVQSLPLTVYIYDKSLDTTACDLDVYSKHCKHDKHNSARR
jgi:hypothetical protein